MLLLEKVTAMVSVASEIYDKILVLKYFIQPEY